MGIHWMALGLYIVGILFSCLITIDVIRRGDRNFIPVLLAGAPFYMLVFAVGHLVSDAGEPRAAQFERIAEAFPKFEEQMVGNLSNGLNMAEYWINKDLAEEFDQLYLAQLRSIAGRRDLSRPSEQ